MTPADEFERAADALREVFNEATEPCECDVREYGSHTSGCQYAAAVEAVEAYDAARAKFHDAARGGGPNYEAAWQEARSRFRHVTYGGIKAIVDAALPAFDEAKGIEAEAAAMWLRCAYHGPDPETGEYRCRGCNSWGSKSREAVGHALSCPVALYQLARSAKARRHQ